MRAETETAAQTKAQPQKPKERHRKRKPRKPNHKRKEKKTMKNFTDYEKENIKKELEKNLDYHKALLKAWEQVTRNYKKDGKPFQDLQKTLTTPAYITPLILW